jgi:DnaJ domain.
VNKSSIKKAYRNKVKETHPDVGGSKKEFKKTEEAKEVLLSHINNVN